MTEYQKMREQQRDRIVAQIEAADERAFYWQIEQEALAEEKQRVAQVEIDRKALIKAAEDLLIANELAAKEARKKEEEERRRREALDRAYTASVETIHIPSQVTASPITSHTSSTSHTSHSSSVSCSSNSDSSSDSGSCSSGGGSCD